MIEDDQVCIIIERVEREEKSYNWVLITTSYEDVLKLLHKENNVEK